MKREKRELFEGYGSLIFVLRLTVKCNCQSDLREEHVILRCNTKLSTEIEAGAQLLEAARDLFAQGCVKVVFICLGVELDGRISFQSKIKSANGRKHTSYVTRLVSRYLLLNWIASLLPFLSSLAPEEKVNIGTCG